jgi:phosphoribosyl-dephospho-CoA transferase
MRSTDAVTRHDLVWLEPFARAEPAAAHAAEAHIIRRWITMGRPLVATRRRAETPSDHHALGLPLPPCQGKRRIALYAPADTVREVRPPPSLQQVIAAAPSDWQGPLRTLTEAAAGAGIGFRVFGSLAWQYLTGKPYVSARSDVDLLWRPGGIGELRRGLEVLLDWEQRFGLRADGEIELPDGTGIAWRELAAKPRKVLVKATTGVALTPLAELLRRFPVEPAAC